MILWCLLPFFLFTVLSILEKTIPGQHNMKNYSVDDWILNLSGFLMQGIFIPIIGYLMAKELIPYFIPEWQGVFTIGAMGALLLNLLFVDLLYYIQHRAFHQNPFLWKFHRTHHETPKVNIWCSSRNALVTHGLFVYLWINPWLGYLCDEPDWFFAGAMITASLDLFRHANIKADIPWLNHILVMPREHHRHHDAEKSSANYGANFIIWDKLFNSADIGCIYPKRYQSNNTPPFLKQFLQPWRIKNAD